MDTYKAEGIILQTTDFGDANRVVTLYTKEFGKLDVNAYGCRRVKSPLAGATQLFNHIKVEISPGTKVDTIREADILYYRKNLTADLDRLTYTSIFFETVNKMTLPRICEPNIFHLLAKSLPVLDTRNPKIAALIGICQFMQYSGVQLNFSHCVHCGEKIEGDAGISLLDGGAVCVDCLDYVQGVSSYPESLRQTFEKMLQFDWREETKLTFKPKQIVTAERFLINYVQSIVGKELNAVKFLRQFS